MSGWKKLFTSTYLKQEDVPAPVVLTIQSINMTEMSNDKGGREEKPVITWANPGVKPMVLNVENSNTLQALYGGEPSDCYGKPIEVWVNPDVTMHGKKTGGLRLRKPGAAPGGRIIYTFAQAIEECAKVGITREELVAGLRSKGLAGYQTGRDTPYVLECIEFARNRAAQQPEESFDDDPSTGPPEPPANDEIPF